jgi:hypothetical protein
MDGPDFSPLIRADARTAPYVIAPQAFAAKARRRPEG